EVERVLAKQKREESAAIAALKRQVSVLKSRLAVAGDKDLHKKVEKLSYLLGEFLAQRASTEDIELSKKMLDELGLKTTSTTSPERVITEETAPVYPVDSSKVELVRSRLVALEHELGIAKALKKSPSLISSLQEKVELLESKLDQIVNDSEKLASPPQVHVEIQSDKIKHDVLFGLPAALAPPLTKSAEIELEAELPLPPPPKMSKKRL
ncbi:hypothetical protein HZC32_02565, partial [Candidatus Woesearchaeota archaeon]|nr:hypothetical protein [Candidatus Woesearchaeota archaeon]